MQGIIEKVTEKGFGFIKSDEHEKGIFFHATSLEGVDFEELNEGDKVEFELQETPRGLNASNVTKL
jgi:CspA family cold shock protein